VTLREAHREGQLAEGHLNIAAITFRVVGESGTQSALARLGLL